jgi:uncharacterized protein (TIGR02145 family)
VQFRISWNNIPTVTGETHNSKIWLWVDFSKIENNQPSGTWTRATVANPSPGTMATETNKGFWLQGSSGSYSQIVTVALENITANTKFNWCAYASDCPPNVTVNNVTYTFKGTPPFTLIASVGTATQTVSGTTLATSALTVTPSIIKDKTECPGVYCKYTGSDLYIDNTHLCQQRTSGAQNWQAYIKDSRDTEIYRIVLMPDGMWWLAQNVRYEGAGSEISGCSKENCGRWYTHTQMNGNYGGTGTGYGSNIQGVCPNGWVLPIDGTWTALAASLNATPKTAATFLTATTSCCASNNTYAWASPVCKHHTYDPAWGQSYPSNSANLRILVLCDGGPGGWSENIRGGTVLDDGKAGEGHTVRCLRQL